MKQHKIRKLTNDVIDMDGFQNGEVLYIPGAMTPTEILSAHDSGAKIVKVYPVSVLGGVQYISALKKPFPDISMVASQGITIDSVGEYIANGASSVVLSDAIFDKEAMAQNNFNVIRQLAHFATLQASQVLEWLGFIKEKESSGKKTNGQKEEKLWLSADYIYLSELVQYSSQGSESSLHPPHSLES
ncbi:hypothetical protein G4B88_019977 [Cannabis sativa]|uniref:Uncharacterized protein n=1 Tax=Cannabis sativa TaxID=3483 RepID=A0A7J6DK10_CANSA|nr:hypothetical protein G4B88_019977 [Cannabis sativa]